MNSPSSIGRRIVSTISAYQAKDYEGACTHLFPAIDKTAKRRHPKCGVGERIRSFIADQEEIISVVSTGSYIVRNSIDGVEFPDAIYKFGRTSIVHEGELDRRLEFTDSGTLIIGEVWSLPASYILGMCVAVMAATENAKEQIPVTGSLKILGEDWEVGALWGAEEKLNQAIAAKFKKHI
jgi:hypothetical protein